MQTNYSTIGSRAAQVYTLVTLVFAAFVAGSLSPAQVQAAGFIEDTYSLPATNDCSEFDTLEYDGYRIYRLNDVWHQIHPCLKFLRSEAAKRAVTDPLYDFVYYQTLFVLSQSEVKFYDGNNKKMTLDDVVNSDNILQVSKFKRITYTGENGQAYDGMGQADFANWALDMHRVYLSKVSGGQTLDEFGKQQSAAYIAVSLGVMETIITPVDKGGLRSSETCGEKINGKSTKCSWYHSKTSDDKKTEDGLTLNKTLSVVRDLWRYGRDLRTTGSTDLIARAEKFESAAIEGVNQMVYGKGMKKSKTPTIFDFVPRDKKGEAIQDSWVYYGLSLKNKKGYYLDKTIEKNCGYHKRNISLLATIFQEFGTEVSLKGFTEKRKDLNNKSILEFMIKAYENKEKANLGKNDKTTSPGNYQRCSSETGAEVTPEMFAYLRSL